MQFQISCKQKIVFWGKFCAQAFKIYLLLLFLLLLVKKTVRIVTCQTNLLVSFIACIGF